MLIKNDKGASVGKYRWEPGDAVDVPDDLAAEIVTIADSGFYVPDADAVATVEPVVTAEVAPQPTVSEVAPAAPVADTKKTPPAQP